MEKLKVNLGCGNDYREGYINIDFSSDLKTDIQLNFLNDEFPFEDDSLSEVVFRETLEHFSRFNGLKVLKKIYQKMKPGAMLDLSVPNSKRQLVILLSKMNDDVTFDDFIHAHERFTFWKWHDDLAGGVTFETDGLDGHSHKTFYSKKSLRSVLEHVGFKIIEIVEDSSFYVKATK